MESDSHSDEEIKQEDDLISKEGESEEGEEDMGDRF